MRVLRKLPGEIAAFLAAPITKRVREWIARRRPEGREIELNQKWIYIFPTAAGWGYLLVCFILILIGINYQNNLIYAFSFLLLALGVLTIHYTFLNLSGLKISAFKAHNCFVNELADFSIHIAATRQRHYENIRFNWQGQPVKTTFLESGESREITLNVRAEKRGVLKPGPLRIETVYPLGLLRAWSWIELEMSAVAYPVPIEGRRPTAGLESDEGEQGSSTGGDDFHGLEEYRPGGSTRHIAWKQFAQGRGLLKKLYSGQTSQEVWLSLEDWPEAGLEGKLSIMSYWALQFEHLGVHYGLQLPGSGNKLTPSLGPAHLESVLQKLALYGADEAGS